MTRLPCALLLISAITWGAWEKVRADGWQDYAHQLERASQAAQRAQEALRDQERTQYQERAHAAATRYAALLAAAGNDTARYVALHRVQDSCSPAEPIGKADPAGVRQDVPADSFVAVSEPDVQACSDATAYAIALREWALSVGE